MTGAFDAAGIQRAVEAALRDAPPAQRAAASADHRPLHQIGQPALWGGNVFDLVTTLEALQSGRGREMNPLLGQNPAVLTAIKLLSTAVQSWLLEQLADAGHPKLATGMGVGLGAVPAVLGVRNLRVGR